MKAHANEYIGMGKTNKLQHIKEEHIHNYIDSRKIVVSSKYCSRTLFYLHEPTHKAVTTSTLIDIPFSHT